MAKRAIKETEERIAHQELIKKLNKQETLLTMGDNYLLFETNFFTEPYQLNEFVFTAILFISLMVEFKR